MTELHPQLRRLDELTTRLRNDPAVLAVLGLGSAGAEHDRFDEHSDIDFFVIVADTTAKQRYIATTDWLSGFGGKLAYEFRNDPNGRKALLADGLFLEYAIFTPDELTALPIAGARIIWARPDHTLAITPVSARPLDSADFHLGEALTNLLVGMHRELRGEHLTAMRFIQVYAIDHVLALHQQHPETRFPQPDPFEPSRRAEQRRSPAPLPLADMVPGYNHNPDAARTTLDWLETHHAPDPAITTPIRDLLRRTAR